MLKNSFIVATVFLGSLFLPFSTHARKQKELEENNENNKIIKVIPRFFQTTVDLTQVEQKDFFSLPILQNILIYLEPKEIGIYSKLSKYTRFVITFPSFDLQLSKIKHSTYDNQVYNLILEEGESRKLKNWSRNCPQGVRKEDFKYNCPPEFLIQKYGSLIDAYNNREKEFKKFTGEFITIKYWGMQFGERVITEKDKEKNFFAFSYCELTAVPSSINSLKNLEIVDLMLNKIEYFELEHTKVHTLKLNGNKGITVNLSLPSLKNLHMRGTDTKKINLKKLNSLEILDLRNNLIASINDITFPDDSTALKEVDLSGNNWSEEDKKDIQKKYPKVSFEF
jgi:hypothetical protein